MTGNLPAAAGAGGAAALQFVPHLMNLLALETSTDRLSLALCTQASEYAYDAVVGQRHAELILAEVEALLRQAGIAVRELHGIVYGEGPGAFTGLRIACGVAQGLALALGVPVLGVGTLEAVAEASGHARVVACIDARMGEVYHAAYEKGEGEWVAITLPGLCAPEALPLPEGGGWAGCGNGFAAYGDALRARLGERLAAVHADVYPQARAMLRLARPRFERGEGRPAAQAVPVYLRDKVALKISER